MTDIQIVLLAALALLQLVLGFVLLFYSLRNQHESNQMLGRLLGSVQQPAPTPAAASVPHTVAPPAVLPAQAKPVVVVPSVLPSPPVSIHDSPNIAALKAANAHRWSVMHVRADKIAEFDKTAARLCAPENKARYQKIAAATKVPWAVIAVIHEREAGGDFNGQLGQGDPLDHVSVHVPTGRGPFLNHPNDPPGEDAFYRSALDALTSCPPYAAKWTDWSIGGLLTILEEYNGLGYANRGVPSAYVWSGSDQYDHGKFIADHVYSASAVDVQEGVAPLISRMAALDPTIFTHSTQPTVT
jgi:lysozyme family protein